MSVSSEKDASLRIGMPDTAERILSLASELAGTSRALAEGKASREAAQAEEDATFKSDGRQLREGADKEQHDADNAWRRRQKRLEEIRDRRDDRLARAVATVRERLVAEREDLERKSATELAGITERLDEVAAAKRHPLEQRVRRWEELLPLVRERAGETERALREFAADYGVEAGST